jgi:hypothetical protein
MILSNFVLDINLEEESEWIWEFDPDLECEDSGLRQKTLSLICKIHEIFEEKKNFNQDISVFMTQ